MLNNRVRWTLMALSAGAGIIHVAIIGPHFEESIWFGVFFLVVAAFQLVWAGMILGLSDRWVLILGAAINLGVIAVWLWSRTAGVPLGPEAGNPEPVAYADVLATGFEALVVLVAVMLLRRHSHLPELARAVPWGVGLVAFLLTTTAVFGGFGAQPAYAHHDAADPGAPIHEHTSEDEPHTHEHVVEP